MTDIVKMTDLAVDDLVTGGGKLRPEQADTFYRKVFEQPGLMPEVRRVQMQADEMKINKIGLGQRIMRVAPSGTVPYEQDSGANNRNLPAAQRFEPQFEQVSLSVKEYMAEIHLTDDVIENNLETENLTNVILTMAAQRIGLDLEELLIMGDTASGDAYLASQNGVLKRVTSNVVDAANTALDLDKFVSLMEAIPVKYRRNLGQMSFYSSRNKQLRYRAAMATRGTPLGDQILSGGGAVPVLGANLSAVDLMPNSTVLFTDPRNILVGMQRDIRLETERMPRSRMTAFIFTVKVGFQLEEEDATAKLINLA